MIKIVMTLDVCAFLYSLLLLIVYFSKKRIKSFETSIFSSLIIVATISVVVEFFQLLFAVIDFDKYFILIVVLAYIYVFTYFIIISYITSYMLLKAYMYKENDSNKILKLKNKLLLIASISSIILFLISVVDCILSHGTTINFDGDSYYGEGISVVFMVIEYILLAASINYLMISTRKYMTKKDLIFYISVIILLIITANLRLALPNLMANNMINVFIVAIMFFTIENPDIKLITELENANDVKDNFLSSMSYEMKTPLNAILGLSSIEEDDDLKDINKEANVLLDIINNVMDSNSFDYDRVREFRETFNIKNSLTSVINETKNNISGKPILFTCNIPDMMITSNSDAIISICDRILSNSYKFTEKGFISFNITVENNNLIINLKDSGKGIPNDQLVNIYDKFNRKKEDVEGTVLGLGLGLSLVKSTVDALYGTIDIKSEVGNGTEVLITIPVEKV